MFKSRDSGPDSLILTNTMPDGTRLKLTISPDPDANRAMYLVKDGDLYLLIITNGTSIDSSSGIVQGVSGNIYTLKPSNSATPFKIESSSTMLTKIEGPVKYTSGITVNYSNPDFDGTWKYSVESMELGELKINGTDWVMTLTGGLSGTTKGNYIIDYVAKKLHVKATYGPHPITYIEGPLNPVLTTIADFEIELAMVNLY